MIRTDESSPVVEANDKAGWQVSPGGTCGPAQRQFRPVRLDHTDYGHLPPSVTPQERLVFMLIGEDKSTKEIAEILNCRYTLG